MTEQTDNKPTGPGAGTLIAMLAVMAAGVTGLSIWMPTWTRAALATWQAGALAGLGLSGLMGLSSLWAVRRAYRATGQGAFVRAVFGTMLIRLVVAGLSAGLVLGFGWLHTSGFVAGVFGGLLVFQMIEIGGVLAAAKRLADPA